MKRTIVSVIVAVFLLVSGVQAADNVLKMATTTSTDNTGLLNYLEPFFEADTGIDLQWVAVGTGKALALGKNCDVDVLLVHAPAAEKKYVADGYGIDRKEVMYNDFVIIGPAGNPAKIGGSSVEKALKTIASTKSAFASRGDNSGTHKKELQLWKSAGLPVPDKQSWYMQTGQGMIATINIAAERDAYTMTDRGTYIKYAHNFKGNAPMVILVEGDRNLLNQYSVLCVNPANCKDTDYKKASAFSNWLAGKKAQKLIADFKLLNKQLFTPNAH